MHLSLPYTQDTGHIHHYNLYSRYQIGNTSTPQYTLDTRHIHLNICYTPGRGHKHLNIYAIPYPLDTVYSIRYGTQRKPWFCLMPSYWLPGSVAAPSRHAVKKKKQFYLNIIPALKILIDDP